MDSFCELSVHLKTKKKRTTSGKNDSTIDKVIKFRCDSNGSTQSNVMVARGWKQVTDIDDTSWNLWWCERSEIRNALDSKLGPRQKVPHFRNHYELTRKDYLWRNLKRFSKLLRKFGKLEEAELADSMPITFELPKEYRMLVEEYNRQGGGTWIVKPAGGSQGRGIFLFRKLKDLADWRTKESIARQQANDESCNNAGESFVVQKYLENPYLLAGRKFDLRIYVLVTSFRPLKVWLAREGFARLSGELFSLDRIDDSRVHLTNMSIQLKVESPRETNVDETTRAEASRAGDCSNDGSATKRGRKWSLVRVREFLTARHGCRTVETLLQRVAGVVMASLQSVEPVMMHASNSFELYGYDIILDVNLKPWLLEVNASPALTPTDDVDSRLKHDLLEDLLNVLDFEGVLTGREIRVGGFDLLWNSGPVWTCCPNGLSPATGEDVARFPRELRRLNIFLGTKNDREEQLKRLREILTVK